jgi:hypothetical protein
MSYASDLREVPLSLLPRQRPRAMSPLIVTGAESKLNINARVMNAWNSWSEECHMLRGDVSDIRFWGSHSENQSDGLTTTDVDLDLFGFNIWTLIRFLEAPSPASPAPGGAG